MVKPGASWLTCVSTRIRNFFTSFSTGRCPNRVSIDPESEVVGVAKVANN